MILYIPVLVYLLYQLEIDNIEASLHLFDQLCRQVVQAHHRGEHVG